MRPPVGSGVVDSLLQTDQHSLNGELLVFSEHIFTCYNNSDDRGCQAVFAEKIYICSLNFTRHDPFLNAAHGDIQAGTTDYDRRENYQNGRDQTG